MALSKTGSGCSQSIPSKCYFFLLRALSTLTPPPTPTSSHCSSLKSDPSTPHLSPLESSHCPPCGPQAAPPVCSADSVKRTFPSSLDAISWGSVPHLPRDGISLFSLPTPYSHPYWSHHDTLSNPRRPEKSAWPRLLVTAFTFPVVESSLAPPGLSVYLGQPQLLESPSLSYKLAPGHKEPVGPLSLGWPHQKSEGQRSEGSICILPGFFFSS